MAFGLWIESSLFLRYVLLCKEEDPTFDMHSHALTQHAYQQTLARTQNRPDLAHADQPVREGKLHISAPHIYGSVLEALDLTCQGPGSSNGSHSFLNIGSGTGYLSCLVAEILGPASSCFGIELQESVVAHSKRAMEAWKANRPAMAELAHMQVIQGNGLEIDTSAGEALVGFDRIYIGAAVERKDLPQLADLLRPGGCIGGAR